MSKNDYKQIFKSQIANYLNINSQNIFLFWKGCVASDCVKTNFEFLFSHYSTSFDYKLGLLNHFLSVFCLFLPLFATLNQIFWLFTQSDVKTAEGKFCVYKPQVRDAERPFCSKLSAFFRNNSQVLEKLALEMYSRGLSTRDIEDALIEATGEL